MSNQFCRWSAIAAVAAVVFANSASLSGQQAAAPRTPDNHPDLTGIWGTGTAAPSNSIQTGNSLIVLFPLKDADPFEGQNLFKELDRQEIVRKAAAPNKPPYKPELMAKVQELSDLQTRLDPAFYCKPQGVPRMGPPNQIVQTPGQLVFLYEARNAFRVIPTDGRPHRDDVDSSYMGDSIGRWDGDTLVVDVTNFTDESWLGTDGWFHSDKMHVVERLRREGDTLVYTATVEDPQVFSRPWELTPRTLKLLTNPGDALMESPPCVEKDGPHLITNEHH